MSSSSSSSLLTAEEISVIFGISDEAPEAYKTIDDTDGAEDVYRPIWFVQSFRAAQRTVIKSRKSY